MRFIIFLSMFNIIMNTASFEQVAEFSSMLFKITDETINDVYNYFVNTQEFQNEYNIRQLELMSRLLLDSKSPNNKAIIKIVSMFIEKYETLYRLVDSFVLPLSYKAILRESNKEYENPIIFNSNGFSISNLHKDDIIEFIDENYNIILTITILEDAYNAYVMSVTKQRELRVSDYSKMSIKFNDINKLRINLLSRFLTDDNDLYCIISSDNKNELSEFILQRSITNTNVNKKYPVVVEGGYDYASFRYLCVYISMIYGSINCFKYLISSGYYERPTRVGDICAIKGGNIEIIRILLQLDKFYNPSKLFSTIITRHNQELLTFWLSRFEPENTKDILMSALRNYNYSAFEQIAETSNTLRFIDWLDKAYIIKRDHFEVVVKYLPFIVRNFEYLYTDHEVYVMNHSQEFKYLFAEDSDSEDSEDSTPDDLTQYLLS